MIINLFHMQSWWNLPMAESASAKVLGWERDHVSWVPKEVAVSRVCWALGEAAPGWQMAVLMLLGRGEVFKQEKETQLDFSIKKRCMAWEQPQYFPSSSGQLSLSE